MTDLELADAIDPRKNNGFALDVLIAASDALRAAAQAAQVARAMMKSDCVKAIIDCFIRAQDTEYDDGVNDAKSLYLAHIRALPAELDLDALVERGARAILECAASDSVTPSGARVVMRVILESIGLQP